MDTNWWEINSKAGVDTPFLAVYKKRILNNIETLLLAVNGDVTKLRPHVKTHKMGAILNLFQTFGIKKIKCATIAEAELGAIHQMDDILLAFQPVGEKQNRWISLIKNYPNCAFSTIVDSLDVAKELSDIARENNLVLNVFLDINAGMNRTGVDYKVDWETLAFKINELPHIKLLGIHIYDGHFKGTVEKRVEEVSKMFKAVQSKYSKLQEIIDHKLTIVAGGSNTFPFYSKIEGVECSPGTFVFWDSNYQAQLPEQQFIPAAVIVATVISKPTSSTICVDIGYKAVASENPLDKRVSILNDEKLIPVAHSEEHLVLENTGDNVYAIGDIIYALPFHICPTCNLYDVTQVVNEEQNISEQWTVLARNRKINF